MFPFFSELLSFEKAQELLNGIIKEEIRNSDVSLYLAWCPGAGQDIHEASGYTSHSLATLPDANYFGHGGKVAY